MSIETAVIAVAGVGTRLFPITTAVDKSLMPIYAGAASQALIDYLIQDCVAAGIKRVIFVTTERGQKQLTDYLGAELDRGIGRQLETCGKTDLLETEARRRHGYNLNFEYIVQPPGVYGTTVPLYLAQSALQGEDQFVLMGGDDFVYHGDGTSELALALASWQASGADHCIMGWPVDRSEAPKYGILQYDSAGRLAGIDEKPPLDRVPAQPVANISRYLLRSSIWEQIASEMAHGRGPDEHYITYPIAAAIAAGQVFNVHFVSGRYLDGGSFAGLLAASNYISHHPH